MRRLELEGQRFGKWTLLKYAGNKKWRCRCDCGKEADVLTGNLRQGFSTQCRECGPTIVTRIKLPPGEAAFNDLYNRYRRAATLRDLEWDLSGTEALTLFKGDCTYCGKPPQGRWGEGSPKGWGKLNGVFIYSGIDRLDSNLGYIKGNCVSCCKQCNYMKRSLSKTEFLEHIRRIFLHAYEAI